MDLAELWPVFGLRVDAPGLELTVPDDQGIAELAEVAEQGVYDPQDQYLTRSRVAGWQDGPGTRAAFLRYVWAARADWTPRHWNLVLAVRVDGVVVGVQEIGAQELAVTGTVSTGSWIGWTHQGRGCGQRMRRAALQLAFDGFGAERAESTAWSDNRASLGVSRRLGYRDNGTTWRSYDGRRIEQRNLAIDRSAWRPDPTITVGGLTDGVRAAVGLQPGDQP
jgi:RimJ/RimL family protein N-acetyltransferase